MSLEKKDQQRVGIFPDLADLLSPLVDRLQGPFHGSPVGFAFQGINRLVDRVFPPLREFVVRRSDTIGRRSRDAGSLASDGNIRRRRQILQKRRFP
jgi:hypothetical protein